ncbi:MAG TPA: tripartite tricarboxylate transporter substrate binding protein [Ramlibacter sp.]|nr:tripartite tricarboxylate transporter substrate binding protein [Ramlibacter sp.]
MSSMATRRAALVLALTAAWVGAGPAAAQDAARAYPTRPVTLIVPYAAGSNGDLVTRLVAHRLATSLGQPIVIDNKPGAGGNLGAELAARAPADGYTLVLTAPSHAVNMSLSAKRRYDVLKDFVPVAMLTSSPMVLIVNPSVPAKNVRELVALAKASPGKLNYASPGNGSTAHMAMELFKADTGVAIQHVPYKGGGEATKDLVGGEVQVMFNAPSTALDFVRSNKVRALGVSSARRSPLAPELPTIAESGIPGYEVLIWQGLLAPAGTPPAIVERLNREINVVLKAPELQKEFTTLGVDALPSTTKEFKDYLEKEVVKWARVVKTNGIKAD